MGEIAPSIVHLGERSVWDLCGNGDKEPPRGPEGGAKDSPGTVSLTFAYPSSIMRSL